MSDYERYGDYNNIDDEESAGQKTKNPVMLTLKIITAAICIGVVGLIAFRLILFSSYPASVKNVYFNDALTAYYEAEDGEISIKTQDLRASYDDEDLGNFFCDYLYVVEDIGQLQITVRYNTATVKRISEKLGVSLDADDSEIFTYRLYASYGEGEGEQRVTGNLTSTVFDSKVMYRYNKLVFDDVDFSTVDGLGNPYWIRLEIFVAGHDGENDVPYMVAIYENNEDYSDFEEYKLSKKELPQ